MAVSKVALDFNFKNPAIFIHGGPGANSGLFLGALLRHGSFALKQRVALHDQPNCGFDTSPLTDYNFQNLCSHLHTDLIHFKKVDLIAESFGCTLAIKFTDLFPEKVKTLTLIGPHFDREDAQKNIFARAENIAKSLIDEIKYPCDNRPLLMDFLNSKKHKLSYKESSSKKWSFAKDLLNDRWTDLQKIEFEKALFHFMKTGNTSLLLTDGLLEVFQEDRSTFIKKRDTPLSTENLKKIAKRYDLFFSSEKTFDEVRKCREKALSIEDSPYSEHQLDNCNKKISFDLEKSTTWESENCWDLISSVASKGVKIRIIHGKSDPFATGESLKEKFINKNECSFFVIENAGHSPIYEKPKETFSILDSEYDI